MPPSKPAEAPSLSGWTESEKSRFEDTDRIFVAPERCDLRVAAEGSPEYWAEEVARRVRPVFDTKRPTALFVGRYQPFHDGHRALIIEGLRRVGQVCIAVRDTAGTDGNNPFDFEYVRARIEHALREFEGRFLVVPLPNITQSSTAATSATPWRGSILIVPCRRSPRRICAAACPAAPSACDRC